MILIKRFILKIKEDGCTGLASMLAFNFFMVIPVAAIMVVAILGELPFLDLTGSILNQLEGVIPDEALDLIIDIVDDALMDGGGILVISLFGTLYVLSNAYAGIIGSLNTIYGVTETRPWIVVRFRALIMSFVAASFLLASFAMVVIAPLVADALSDTAGAQQIAATWIDRMRWPAIIILAVVGIESSYKFGPNGGPRWRLVSPGTLFSTGAWVVATWLFGFYVNNFTSYDRLYGTLGTVVALLILLWISSLIFLVGAEVNSFWSRSSRVRKMLPEQLRSGHPDV
ncbi:MAG: YihY/virulence factor BrkB family protein [Gaiellales bacterium]|nr:MAG: YihY/virulence factor BrkB family protein [Gaiellales bacterium]